MEDLIDFLVFPLFNSPTSLRRDEEPYKTLQLAYLKTICKNFCHMVFEQRMSQFSDIHSKHLHVFSLTCILCHRNFGQVSIHDKTLQKSNESLTHDVFS